ncbi:cytochrome c biogenesis CcdA family protein [Desulfosarcina ovata]|uniref:Cytochrome C biogenesis protein CcdA n=2 Tax=Desulfosarcina ovata TaxID=83564 RepID=A0A5K8AIM0_9BACT|nr:cytochrome c biogenesis protein CcdA [Desulfosarcina ovata]BBO85482.1 cytochrome C biogenesis protein CcdA [Desulfosarcina ovata subsp. sediminis]BBO92517.1 cytochrome C biogenesis protein CcdA [Desulfosarcina ovata subsp. ovata]
MFTETISYPAALLAGLLSFFSPCILPLIPAYFTFITGLSLEELTQAKSSAVRIRVVLATLCYVLGFSLVFILMGASASYMGGLIFQYRDWIRVIGGILIIVLGIHMTGLLRFKALEFEHRFQVQKKPLHFLGTFMVGMAFGAGWSPCIGPLLGSILIVAGNQATVANGIGLLAVYAGGLALPFLMLSIFVDSLLTLIKKAAWSIKYINITAGGLLFIIGLLLVTNNLSLMSV